MGTINIQERIDLDKQIIYDFYDNKISLKASDYSSPQEFKESVNILFSVLSSWRVEDIIDLLKQHFVKKVITDGIEIPQFSDFYVAVYTTPKKMMDPSNYDVSYIEMGKLLEPKEKEDGAHTKYGENHAKTAYLIGLVSINDSNKVNISDFGREFMSLNPYMQASVIPALCLKLSLLYNYFCQNEDWKSIEDDLVSANLSESTKKRRRSNARAMISVVKSGFYSDIILYNKYVPVLPESKDRSIAFYQYLAAIRTKPFILLAGISGTGKSQIVKEMAFATCPNLEDLQQSTVSPGNYCLVEVKPNWHDSSELLGYDSAIKKRYVVTPFVKFVVKAMKFPEVPFFMCLDEMNLAPVEQYFAEFLSVLESRKLINDRIVSEPLIASDYFKNNLVALDLFDLPIGDYKGLSNVANVDFDEEMLGDNAHIWRQLQKDGLCIPQNLIVIGTVNMDETTHQFSRKVIDRAMTFEMNEADFESYFEDKVALNFMNKPLDAKLFLSRNVSGNKAMRDLKTLKIEEFKAGVAVVLGELNDQLEDTPFKIAYRVQNELVLYFVELMRENSDAKQDDMLGKALDDIMMMKVLPRIEGDDELLGSSNDGPLSRLKKFAISHHLTKSQDKIEEMLKRLERSHFTSFWP